MDKLSGILLSAFITENLFLALFLLGWKFRECKKCHKVKEITRLMDEYCEKCKGNGKEDIPKKKEKYEL